jgi:lipoate---protein ligase
LQLYKARKQGQNLREATSLAELLAREEALLDYCEENTHPGFLAFWEAQDHFVVLGYGKHLSTEVDEEECKVLGIPILRRASGGGTVLQGPGCLNYTLVLPIDSRPELESITTTNRYIMEKTRAALAPLVVGEVKVEGHTDLTIHGRKFSGNAQRRKRRCLLFHGSFLLTFDLDRIYRTLRMPQQQPDYRASRPHAEFVTNLNIESDDLEKALTSAWNVTVNTPPQLNAEINTRAKALVGAKYGRDDWNRRI